MSIRLKNPSEIAHLRAAGQLVAETFARLAERVHPGVTLAELDQFAADFLKRHSAQPLYKGYRGKPPNHPPFPGVVCASVNNEVCHGLPDGRALQNGDIVAIDIGLKYKGFCGDSCVTYAVGDVKPQARRLLAVTEECLWRGIEAAQPGRHLGEIGVAIQTVAEGEGFSVVREWGGHGIGRSLHEDPSVPHVGPANEGPLMRPGMVFTIEPMINAGVADWILLKDGWTVVTKDGSLSAQFEHTVAITRSGPEILSKL